MLIGKRFKLLSSLMVMLVLTFLLLAYAGPASASLPAPQFMPNGGSFVEPVSVTITNSAPGDPVYYTTDSSDPETSGTRTLYAGAFTVSQSETVTAAVYDKLFGWSGLASDAFDIYTSSLVPAPLISPDSGSFTSPQTVTITDIPGGDTCYYTTDGSYPSKDSTAVPYTGPFTVTQSEQIKAVNYTPSDKESGVTVTTFNITGSSLVPAPTISPDGGSFTSSQTVNITGIPSGDICYYTTDGSDPRSGSAAIYKIGGSTFPFTVWSGTVQAANYGYLIGQWSSVTAATFTVIGSSPPPAPSISPDGGSFTSPQTVTITGIPSGDLCYYNINGGSRVVYTGPITVSQPETINAFNYSTSAGWSTTTVANFVIGFSLAISPDGGSFTSPQTVTITGIPGGGGNCYYTTDGSDPSSLTAEQQYTGPFTVSRTETVKAFFEGLTGNSSVISATFVINGSQTVAITPAGGSFATPQTVTIAGIPSGDTCSYTTDGSNPTTSGAAVTYSGAFTVGQSETVQAAVHDPTSGWGGVTTATFTIGGVPSSQAPIITPDGGAFTAPQSVTVTGIPDGDACYYATDASGLKDGGYPYIGPFTVSQSETVYVANQDQAGDWGEAASATFTINDQVTVPPVSALTPGEISTVAGNGDVGISGDNGPATGAWLDSPNGVAVDASGNIYIADSSNNRIRKVSSSGAISTVAGNGTAGYSGDGGPAISAELDRPYGVAVDASGNIYIADTYNQRIRKVSASGAISTVAGNGRNDGSTLAINGGGYSGDGGPAISAELNGPLAVAVDASGNIYIADTYNNRIRKLDTSGAITTVAGNGQGGLFGGNSGDGGPAISAELAQPTGVAVDASGNVYFISDQYNNCLRKVDTSGAITTVGYGGSLQGYTGHQALSTNSAATSLPAGVAVDASGDLYFSDGYDGVRQMDSATGAITIVAGKVNTPGYSGDGGAATAAELNCPDGVAVDPSGDIFIADSGNNRLREVKASGPASSLPSLNASTPTASLSTEQTTSRFTVGQSSYVAGGQSFAMDAAPFISNERALVPERYLADALGAQTAWDAATRRITVTKGGTTIDLTVGSTSIATNGKTGQMDTAPLIENGRTYLPARYVAEALGYKVSWEAEAQAVTVAQQSP